MDRSRRERPARRLTNLTELTESAFEGFEGAGGRRLPRTKPLLGLLEVPSWLLSLQGTSSAASTDGLQSRQAGMSPIVATLRVRNSILRTECRAQTPNGRTS